MTKQEQMESFEPDGVGQVGTLFGLPFTPETAEVVILPVPWEVTVSYAAGTALGPQAVLDASPQIDYHLADIPNAWKMGLAMEPISSTIKQRSDALREKTAQYIHWLESNPSGNTLPSPYLELLEEVNAASRQLSHDVKQRARAYLDQGKVVGVLGGDHSTPLGLIQGLAEQYSDFGILQIDAHADLRQAYEGFTYSHASIMTNALKLPQISRVVQVGIRDYASSEAATIQQSKGRIRTFFDQKLKEEQFRGKNWDEQCADIVEALPQMVYISFDIDGLSPELCPHTGTPVPGGFQLAEVLHLIKRLVFSGRKIIGFDLNEVAPGLDQWDGNVGARALYPLACWAGASMGKAIFLQDNP